MTDLADEMFVICDDENTIVSMQGVRLFDRRCSMPAFFCVEQEALDVLYELEQRKLLLRPCAVHRLSARNLTMNRLMAGEAQ